MLRKARTFQGKPVLTRDGPIGPLVDLYFDELQWRIHHLLVDTGLKPGRQVLVSPAHVLASDAPPLRLRLSRLEVARCPEAAEDKPLYLQNAHATSDARRQPLRSCGQLAGHAVLALDGFAGRVHDLLVDFATWRIESLVIDTGNWFLERETVVAPSEVRSIDWIAGELRLQLRRDAVRHRPKRQVVLAPPLPKSTPP